MIRVNLLAERKQKKRAELLPGVGKKRIPAFLTTFAIVTGATVLVMGLIVFLLKFSVSSLQAEYQTNQNKITEFKKKIDEVRKYEALNKAIQQKSALIETLKKNQSVPARLLDDISKLLPDGVWLTSVIFNNPQAVIEGAGFTNTDIVVFVDNLKKSISYSDVYLEETKQVTVEKTEVYNFKLNFKVRI